MMTATCPNDGYGVHLWEWDSLFKPNPIGTCANCGAKRDNYGVISLKSPSESPAPPERVKETGLPGRENVPERNSTQSSPIPAPTPPRAAFASAQTVRAAILHVIDYGDEDKDGTPICWMLEQWEGNNYREDITNETRLRFCDAVERRILELQATGLGTRLQDYCPRHMRARLPEPTVFTCVDCQKEQQK